MAGQNPPPAKVNFGQVGLEFLDLRPEGGATVILADPPWRFGTWSQKGVTKKGAGGQYDCMAIEDIMRLPVATLAAPDCCLWLWATNPMLPQALMVMSAWGFEFKTAGTWVKRSKLGKMLIGTGYVLRSCNEPFLLGVRGKPKVAKPGWGAHGRLRHLGGDDLGGGHPCVDLSPERVVPDVTGVDGAAGHLCRTVGGVATALEPLDRAVRVGGVGDDVSVHN